MAKNSHSSGRGPSQRQLRVGELIRRNLSEILMRGDIHDPDLNRISITVGEVRCTPDLHIATAFILPLGGEGAEDALALLRKNRHEIRRMIGKKMALKHTPELRYEIDMTFDQMDATRRLLENETVQRDVAAPDEGGDL
ncbi:30S ribosome-binding factor RbfA [Halocynthiibacter sp.]|uniref:30S ribosome-binding factor RbfA n=1 Tax=Halocynthiibacter sp. TaxID=1979210 RepID=UPI003C520494